MLIGAPFATGRPAYMCLKAGRLCVRVSTYLALATSLPSEVGGNSAQPFEHIKATVVYLRNLTTLYKVCALMADTFLR